MGGLLLVLFLTVHRTCKHMTVVHESLARKPGLNVSVMLFGSG